MSQSRPFAGRALAAAPPALLALSLLALGGCAAPTTAPATPPAAATADPAAGVGTAAPYTPAIVATEVAPDPGAVAGQMADEALTNVQERLQAITLRVAALPQREGPARDIEMAATVTDLEQSLAQLELVRERAAVALSAEHPDRAQRLAAVLDSLEALMDQAAQVEGMAPRVAPLAGRLDALRSALALPPAGPAATPGTAAAPAGTAAATP